MAATPDPGRRVVAYRPLLWHALAFCLGVALAYEARGAGRPGLGLAALCLLLAAVRRFHGRLAFACGLLAAMASGAAWSTRELRAWETQPLREYLGRTVDLVGLVASPPEVTEHGTAYRLDVRAVAPRPGYRRELIGRVRIRHDQQLQVPLGALVRVRVKLVDGTPAGNPGQRSFRRNLRAEDLAAIAWRAPPPTVLAKNQGARLARWSAWLRDRLCGNLRRAMPEPDAGFYGDLYCGLVFGVYAAPVDDDLSETFRRVGVIHVLVASGTQVSLLIGLVYFLCRLLPLPSVGPLLLGTAVIGSYVLVTGAEPSILRAAVMGWIVLIGLTAGEDYDLPTSLAVAAAVLLILRPSQIADVGFQLSFAATTGIAALGVPLGIRLAARLPAAIAFGSAMTVGAQLFVAPVLVYHFRALSLSGLLANLPVIPVCGFLVVLGLGTSLLGGPLLPVAGGLCRVAHLLLALMVTVVRWFASLRGGWLDPFVSTPTQIAGYALLLAGVCFALSPPDGRRWWTRPRVIILLLAVATAWSGWRTVQLSRPALTLTVLDVGMGDSLLLTGPTGRRVLVDGGPLIGIDEREHDAGRERVIPALMLRGTRRLDAVFGTHHHADHSGGLPVVMRAWPPGRVLLPPGWAAEPGFARVVTAARELGREPETLARGARLDLGGGAQLEVLWPPAEPVEGTGSDVNNNALVLKVVYGQVSVLLASDLESAGEEFLTRLAGDLSATVLKVPHQGSRDSCSPDFLDAVDPKYAVISVGPNVYGHPTTEVLDRLAARGVTIDRTDRGGMIVYRLDGQAVSVRRFGRH